MAKPRTNYIIQESKISPNMLEVWTPATVEAKGLIEAIEGVVRVGRITKNGRLDVRLNPCYSRVEIEAEIIAALSEQCEPGFAQRPEPAWKPVSAMDVGEIGYVCSWVVSRWVGLHALNGLNLNYSVFAEKLGLADTPICRTRTGWVVGGKVFAEVE